MAVYTHLTDEHVDTIRNLSGIDFDGESIEPIQQGSTDTSYSLSDEDGRSYFLKVHETPNTSPHSPSTDQRHMVEFANYLSCFNREWKALRILRPVSWRDGKSYGILRFSTECEDLQPKVVSLWPYVTPNHLPSRSSSINLIELLARATGELHKRSTRYSPRTPFYFQKGISDTVAVIDKTRALPSKQHNLSIYLESNPDEFLSDSRELLSYLESRIERCKEGWSLLREVEQLETAYIHGELKPSNTIMGEDGRVIFIDISKAGLAPLVLEVGMAAHSFSDMRHIDVEGIGRFIATYLDTVGSYPKRELISIPLMIETACLRLAAYRCYAIAFGGKYQKSVFEPIHACLQLDRIKHNLIGELERWTR